MSDETSPWKKPKLEESVKELALKREDEAQEEEKRKVEEEEREIEEKIRIMVRQHNNHIEVNGQLLVLDWNCNNTYINMVSLQVQEVGSEGDIGYLKADRGEPT